MGISNYSNMKGHASMGIYKPTYLYIKQHNVTGLKYFGKTTKDSKRYKGSGVYWKRHLKTHGADISTLWYQLFEDQDSLTQYALKFSADNDIVNSNVWANLHPENGLDGGATGRTIPDDIKQKISAKLAGIPTPNKMTDDGKRRVSEFMKQEHKRRPRLSMLGKTHTAESKLKNSDANRNRPRFECPHCGKKCQRGTYTRWHGDNCKLNS